MKPPSPGLRARGRALQTDFDGKWKSGMERYVNSSLRSDFVAYIRVFTLFLYFTFLYLSLLICSSSVFQVLNFTKKTTYVYLLALLCTKNCLPHRQSQLELKERKKVKGYHFLFSIGFISIYQYGKLPSASESPSPALLWISISISVLWLASFEASDDFPPFCTA